MGVVFEKYHFLWSVHLKLLSTISREESGLYHGIATRASYTRLLVCIACTTPFLDRASKVLKSAVNSPSTLITDVFSQSAHLVYTATGFNAVYGHSFRKLYNDQDYMSAAFVRLVKLKQSLNIHISSEELNHICCA